MATAEPYGAVKKKGMLLGDDNWAIVEDEDPPYKNTKGIEMKRYLVIPHPHLIKQYPQLQKPDAINVRTPGGMAIWVEYPTYWIDDRNPSRTHAIVRITCGFDGRETLQTRRYKRYTDEIQLLLGELENTKISNIHLVEENRKLLSEKKDLMKDVYELQQMQPRRPEYDREGEEDREH